MRIVLVALALFGLAAPGAHGQRNLRPQPPSHRIVSLAYSGMTSQQRRVKFTRAMKGVRFALAWAADCGDGGPLFLGTTSNSVALPTRRNGSFSHRETFSGRAADGVLVRYEVAVAGKVTTKRVTGSWRLTVSGGYIDGDRYSCKTGAVSWVARGRSAKRTVSGRSAVARSASATGLKLGLKTTTRSPGKRSRPTASGVGLSGGVGQSGNAGTGSSGGSGPQQGPVSPLGRSVVSGQVVFDQQDCYAGGVARRQGLSSAQIRFVSERQVEVETSLDVNGRFANVTLPPGNDIQAYAVTEGPRVRVAPDLLPVVPYKLALGPVTALTQTYVVGAGAASGAANVHWMLDRAAQAVAGGRSPVVIPRVTALWRYRSDLAGWIGDVSPSTYDPSTQTIVVGGRANGTRHDEWERYPLLHEFGHHVLQNVASSGPNVGGPHSQDTVSPTDPALAWTEGFANAYPAIVEENAQLTLGCTTRVDLGSAPASYKGDNDAALTPMPRTPERHLAQYNETTIGGVVLGVANRLGAGHAMAGLPRLLTVLHNYSVAHAGPVSVREFRDALIEDGSVETTALEHQEINELFQRQRIQWGIEVSPAGSGLDDSGMQGRQEIQAVVHGPAGTPYANCAVADEFANLRDHGDAPRDFHFDYRILGSRGGIDYAWQDDCYADTDGDSDDIAWNSHDGQVIVPFPYAAGSVSGHDPGKLTVSYRYTCTGQDCLASVSLAISIDSGYAYWRAGLAPSQDPLELGTRWHETPPITLQHGQWVDVAEYDASGHCKSLTDGFDCSR